MLRRGGGFVTSESDSVNTGGGFSPLNVFQSLAGGNKFLTLNDCKAHKKQEKKKSQRTIKKQPTVQSWKRTEYKILEASEGCVICHWLLFPFSPSHNSKR